MSLSKKKRAANDARFEDAWNKAGVMNDAKSEYKQAKKERKQALKTVTKQMRKDATLTDKLIYNDATRKKAAKYVVDNNMSVTDATKKAKGDTWRNTALVVAGYGAVTVASLYANR